MNNIKITLLIFGFSLAQFNWQDDGLAIRQGVHVEWQRTADMDLSSDEFIFAWSDTRQGGRDIYIQKTNDAGQKLWGENGLVVVQEPGRQEDPILISDQNGGAYVVWVDYKNEPVDGDIYAQHILSDGSLAWAEEGIGLATNSGKQVSPNMCSDGQGGAYVIWKDLTASSYAHVYGTHLSTSGALSPGTGIPILSNESYHNNVSIERGGQGHAVLVWSDDVISDNADIRTQRIDQSCNTLWSAPEEGGILLCSEQGNQLYPKVTYYDELYTILVWEDHRNSAEFGDIYYQFLDLDGNEVLESQGVSACLDSSNQIKPRVKASFDGAFIVWEDYRNGNSDIYSQKVDHLGNLYWENDGRSIVSESGVQDQCRLSTDGNGGVYYVWLDERTAPYPETDVYMQYINTDNEVHFEENGVAICDADYYQFAPIIRGFDGQALMLWGDRRTGSIGLYLQHIDPSLSLGLGEITLEDKGREMFFGIDGNGQSPKLTHLENEALIYWDDRRYSPFENLTYGFKLSDELSLLDSQNGVSLSSNSYQSNASFVYTGAYLFMGFGQTDGDINQYYSILDNQLSTLVDYSPVDANPQASQEYYEIVFSEFENEIYYVYSDNREFANNIYVMKFDDNGNETWDSPIKIVETLQDGFLPSDDNVIGVISNPNEDGIIVLYNSGNFLGTKVNAIAIDLDGQVLSDWDESGNRLCEFNSDQYIEDFVATPHGLMVTFKDNRSGSNDVYAQLVDYSNGNLLFDVNGLSIADSENDQESSSMAFSDQGNEALVCWEDFRLGTEYDLYCRSIAFTIDGDYQLLDEFELAGQSNTSGGNQTNPYVFSDDLSFLIAWEDSRNGVYTDIYFQELNNFQVVLEDGGQLLCGADFDQLNPKIGLLDSLGNYLIYWDDMRSSGKEFLNNVFAQSYSLGGSNLSNEITEIPMSYAIQSAYPNPFNPSVSIEFTIQNISSVKLSIVDIKGSEIEVLYNGDIVAGTHLVDWQPSYDLSSGLYFAKLTSNDNSFSSVHKITFLK